MRTRETERSWIIKQDTWTNWKLTAGLSCGEYSYSVSRTKISCWVLSVCSPGDQVDLPVCQLWEKRGLLEPIHSCCPKAMEEGLASLTASAGGSRYHLHQDHLQQAVAPYKGLFCSGWEEVWTLTEGTGSASLRPKISRPRCIKVCSFGLSQLPHSDQIWSWSPREIGGVKSLGQQKGKVQRRSLHAVGGRCGRPYTGLYKILRLFESLETILLTEMAKSHSEHLEAF